MGQVCAKNDAGKVATDAPRPRVKRDEKQLTSQQTLPQSSTTVTDTKYVRSELNFNIDKGVEKKADQVAMEVANQWCSTNPDWTYTGQWKNERVDDGSKEVSLFQVRSSKQDPDQPTVIDVRASVETVVAKGADHKIGEDLHNSKKTVTDVKQSFVDQVAEGLALKIPPERFARDDEMQDDPNKSTSPTGPTTAEKSKDGDAASGTTSDKQLESAPAAQTAQTAQTQQEIKKPEEEPESSQNNNDDAAPIVAEKEQDKVEIQEEQKDVVSDKQDEATDLGAEPEAKKEESEEHKEVEATEEAKPDVDVTAGLGAEEKAE